MPVSTSQSLIAALTREDNIRFDSNIKEVEILQEPLTQLQQKEIDGSVIWFHGNAPTPANTRVIVYPTGHSVFYNSLGLRMLMTDPGGHALHEAEWVLDPESQKHQLKQARMQLDSRQWVGIKPRAKRFSTRINIKGQPGWETITLDELRKGASQAWQVPESEVNYFYKDENFVAKGDGEYDVWLDKDGLYALVDGTFEKKTLFLSFMFTVNWEQLDLIPVVELFQSTLPGTGGAVFEFIWGLHADQSRATPLAPLRYRGLPTYPSQEAFNLFSAFFNPKEPAGEKVMEVFMDPDRSHEIEWTPQPQPPWRYFSEEHTICLTVQENYLFKVTAWDDPVGISYTNTARGGTGSCGRYLAVTGDRIYLHDGSAKKEIPISPQWNIKDQQAAPHPPPATPFDWQHFFDGAPPATDPVKLLYTVPLYPEGAEEIQESAMQPMVLDQIFHYMEDDDSMPDKLEKMKSVLIHTFDAVIAGCIDCTQKREYTVLYGDPEFGVKNAQQLWNFAASRDQLEGVRNVKFLNEAEHVDEVYKNTYDMIFKWIPFFYHPDRDICEKILNSTAAALKPGGLLFLQGPAPLRGLFDHYQLNCLKSDNVVDMPFFQQHLKLCPENQLNPQISVFLAEKK